MVLSHFIGSKPFLAGSTGRLRVRPEGMSYKYYDTRINHEPSPYLRCLFSENNNLGKQQFRPFLKGFQTTTQLQQSECSPYLRRCWWKNGGITMKDQVKWKILILVKAFSIIFLITGRVEIFIDHFQLFSDVPFYQVLLPSWRWCGAFGYCNPANEFSSSQRCL